MHTHVKQTYASNVNVSITRKNGRIESVTTWITGVPGSTNRERSEPTLVTAQREAVTPEPARVPHARIAKGVAWLDANRPNWREQVNLDTLDMGSCKACILGQVFSVEGEASFWGEGYSYATYTFAALDAYADRCAMGFTGTYSQSGASILRAHWVDYLS